MAIEFQIESGVGTITLARPKQRNAMNSEMLQKLEDVVAKANSDEAIKVLRIIAQGPSFCAGSDLTELGGLSIDEMCLIEARKAALLRSFSLCTKPVVAAVQGYAVGGGAFLAAVCDVTVMAEDVKLKCMEVPNGWITPWGMHALDARLSARDAQRAAWGYDFIDMEEASRIGLADHVASNDDYQQRSAEIAQDLAQMPAISVQATKAFFQDKLLGLAEVEDARLNALFHNHCSDEAAQATFKKFAK